MNPYYYNSLYESYFTYDTSNTKTDDEVKNKILPFVGLKGWDKKKV